MTVKTCLHGYCTNKARKSPTDCPTKRKNIISERGIGGSQSVIHVGDALSFVTFCVGLPNVWACQARDIDVWRERSGASQKPHVNVHELDSDGCETLLKRKRTTKGRSLSCLTASGVFSVSRADSGQKPGMAT